MEIESRNSLLSKKKKRNEESVEEAKANEVKME